MHAIKTTPLTFYTTRNGNRNSDKLAPKLRRGNLMASPIRQVPRIRRLHLVRRLVHHRRTGHPPVRTVTLPNTCSTAPTLTFLITKKSVVPETKGLSLEELSDVFRIPTARHAKFGFEQAGAFFNWCLARNPRWPVLLQKKPRVVEVEHMTHGYTEEYDVPMVDVLRS